MIYGKGIPNTDANIMEASSGPNASVGGQGAPEQMLSGHEVQQISIRFGSHLLATYSRVLPPDGRTKPLSPTSLLPS